MVGRVALVTGGGRELGRFFSMALADAGMDVAVAARSVDQLKEAADRIRAKGRRALDVPIFHRAGTLRLRVIRRRSAAAPLRFQSGTYTF